MKRRPDVTTLLVVVFTIQARIHGHRDVEQGTGGMGRETEARCDYPLLWDTQFRWVPMATGMCDRVHIPIAASSLDITGRLLLEHRLPGPRFPGAGASLSPRTAGMGPNQTATS